ncbi:MAG: hypothetical protein ABMB14_33075 [Myxococcota bacterium]
MFGPWLASACVRPSEPPPVDVPVPTPAPTTAPDHDGRLVLTVGPVAAGIPVAFTVRNLYPGDTLRVAWSVDGPGADPLDGAPTGLASPIGAADAVADLSYAATAAATLEVDPGATVWAQGLVVRVADGASEATAVVARPAFDPALVAVGDVVVADAGDLDALDGVAAITGALRIEDTPLAAVSLPGLVQVGGSITVWDDPALETLSLPALRWVGGDLSLYADPALAAVDGLAAVEAVGGTLAVHRMDRIRDLDPLVALSSVEGDLYLYHDLQLDHVALPALRSLGGNLDLWELDALDRVSLPALTRIEHKLDVFVTASLVDLDLPVVASIGSFELHHADAMTDVGTFPELVALPGDVDLQYTPSLVGLTGFARVERVRTLRVQFVDGLGSFGDLTALTTVDTALELFRLPSVTALDLPALASCGTLKITRDDALVDPGLPALTEVRGAVEIRDNPGLSTCAIEALLDRLAIGGAVTCGGNLADGCAAWCAPEGA